MDYGRRERAEALAAEYVAGSLRGPARRRFEALLSGHPALRAAVADWNRRLMPLSGVVEPVAPPPRVWQRIEQRLWPAAPAPAPLPWWQRLALWRGVAALALAASVGLGLVLGLPGEVQPPVVVVLQSTGKDPAVSGSLVASFSADGRAVVATPIQRVQLDQPRSLELWWAPAVGAPRSLGLIKGDGTTVLDRRQLPGGIRGSGIDHMAVSVEPPGGSPTGQPTGPVIFYGKLQL